MAWNEASTSCISSDGGAEGESFVRAARSVSKQLGQALALSRMFSKLQKAGVIDTNGKQVHILDSEKLAGV